MEKATLTNSTSALPQLAIGKKEPLLERLSSESSLGQPYRGCKKRAVLLHRRDWLRPPLTLSPNWTRLKVLLFTEVRYDKDI